MKMTSLPNVHVLSFGVVYTGLPRPLVKAAQAADIAKHRIHSIASTDEIEALLSRLHSNDLVYIFVDREICLSSTAPCKVLTTVEAGFTGKDGAFFEAIFRQTPTKTLAQQAIRTPGI